MTASNAWRRDSWRHVGPIWLIRHTGSGHRQAAIGFSKTMAWLNLWKFTIQLRFGNGY